MTATTSRSTRREDLVTLLLALWTLIGLLVDAFYHSTDPGLESFWTPWHALFYSGFTATAAWLGWMALKRNDGSSANWLDWAPTGYRTALIGVVLFSIGGIGDAIWHTIFGVETSIDALLSPTHLFLFAGLLMILSAPLRAAWLGDGSRTPTFGQFFVPLASLVFTSTLVAFMLTYAWAPSLTNSIQTPYDPNDFFSELMAERVVVSIIISTLVMFVPLMAAGLRWRLPFGSATLFLTFLNVAIALGFDEDLIGIPAAIVAGLTFDFLVTVGARRTVVTAIPPLVLWGLLFASIGFATEDGLGLAPEIWGGAIVLASMALLTVELLIGAAEKSIGAAANRPPVGEARVGEAPSGEPRVGEPSIGVAGAEPSTGTEPSIAAAGAEPSVGATDARPGLAS
ncbi:MAG: hypothetical protein ACR2QK_07825, partial [Acidimicrobiales bacterium]